MEPIRHHPFAHGRAAARRTSTPTRSSRRASCAPRRAKASASTCSPTGATTRAARRQPDFVLNQPEAAGLRDSRRRPQLRLRLLARARAVGAARLGFRAVVSTEIADIFRSNSLKNGLVPVLVDEATQRSGCSRNPGAEVTVDLETQHARAARTAQRVDVPHRAVRALLPAERRRRAGLPAAARTPQIARLTSSTRG